MVCIGALHCLDAGVTADIIGNILWEAVLWLGLPGRTQKLRVIPLWRMMQQFYKDNSVKGGLQGLTILMIKQQGKSPQIRCKAAQARHLIGFAGLVAQGVGIWIGFQSFINMGVNLGALPTKGLTLPLMSYGGSAILLNMVAIAIVLRIDSENKQMMRGGRS